MLRLRRPTRRATATLAQSRASGKAAALLIGALLSMTVASAAHSPAAAEWLSKILRGAGEIGEVGTHTAKAGKLAGLGALETAAVHVAKMPVLPKGAALAAHATPEGHWKFVNREGEVFTAANAEELARVAPTLAPGLASDGKLAIYLSEDTIFAESRYLKDLPPDAELHLVSGKQSYRLLRSGADQLAVEMRPLITMQLDDRALFREAAYQLSRPLNRASMRVLALEPGGPQTLSSVPRFDPATRAALVDRIDPATLAPAMRQLRGQTVVVSGRLESDALVVLPASGSEQRLMVRDLVAAAEAADVNLVLVNAKAARQPGGTNWLWQKVEVAGLDEALKRATFADFLSSLGANGGELTLTASRASPGRITLSAIPHGESRVPFSGTLEGWLGEITGHVVSLSVDVFARDEESQTELDARFIPGVPSLVQFYYLGGMLAGLIATAITYPWWSRIWPPEDRAEYGGRAGFYAARAVRMAAYVLLFLPVAGFPALLWSFLCQLWNLLTAPVRAVRWVRARLGSSKAATG